MTTFWPRVVKCVARHLFAFPRLSPLSCVRLFPGLWVSGCIWRLEPSLLFLSPGFHPGPSQSELVTSSFADTLAHSSWDSDTCDKWLDFSFNVCLIKNNIWQLFQLIRIIASSRWKLARNVWSWVVLSHGIGWCLIASEEAVSCFPAGPIARMFSCFYFSVLKSALRRQKKVKSKLK